MKSAIAFVVTLLPLLIYIVIISHFIHQVALARRQQRKDVSVF